MKTNALEWLGCSTGAILTVVQTNEIFQVISLVLTILATLVTLAFTIYKWYKMAMKDNKIDDKEIEELVDIVIDGTNKLNNIVSDKTEDKGEK